MHSVAYANAEVKTRSEISYRSNPTDWQGVHENYIYPLLHEHDGLKSPQRVKRVAAGPSPATESEFLKFFSSGIQGLIRLDL